MQAPDTWYVPCTDITPDPNNPRVFKSDEAYFNLAKSIKSHGIIQPIVLRPTTDDDREDGITTPWVIVAGERRWRAAQGVGVDDVPCTLLSEVTVGGSRTTPSTAERHTMSVDLTSELALIENIQRQNLTPIEEGGAFKRVLSLDEGTTVQSLADRLGLSPDYIRKRIALLALPDAAQTAVDEGTLSLNAALCIHALVGKVPTSDIAELVEVAVAKRWPVARIEKAAAALMGTAPRARYARPEPAPEPPPAPRPAPAAPSAPASPHVDPTGVSALKWSATLLPPLGEKVGKLATVHTQDGVKALIIAHRDPKVLALVEEAVRATIAAQAARPAGDEGEGDADV